MKKAIPLLAVAFAAAASLSAYAGIGSLESTPESAKLAQVHAGLTQDQVSELAGRPDVATLKDPKGDLWIYEARNEYGELAEYDVSFDASGNVSSITSFDVR